MKVITKQNLIQALKQLGLHPGDTVFIHSDLRGLGMPEDASSHDAILKFYEEALLDVIGKEGTIAVPAYFYEYARFGTPFDVDHSPVSEPLGAFSAWINSRPGRIRSFNPLQSIAALGARATELAGGTSLSGYGVTSPWHRLRLMGGKILFLGAPIQSMTYVHYIEQHFGVPHLYFKTYPYPVIKNGVKVEGHVISAVRYLEFKVEYLLDAYQQALDKQGVLHTQMINDVPLYLVDAKEAYRVGIACLDQNPYFFLKHPPHFIAGKIPMDGVTGPT